MPLKTQTVREAIRFHWATSARAASASADDAGKDIVDRTNVGIIAPRDLLPNANPFSGRGRAPATSELRKLYPRPGSTAAGGYPPRPLAGQHISLANPFQSPFDYSVRASME